MPEPNPTRLPRGPTLPARLRRRPPPPLPLRHPPSHQDLAPQPPDSVTTRQRLPSRRGSPIQQRSTGEGRKRTGRRTEPRAGGFQGLRGRGFHRCRFVQRREGDSPASADRSSRDCGGWSRDSVQEGLGWHRDWAIRSRCCDFDLS
ncbi:hypothetical protein U1Q18_030406 [Sarracenia purpurea var. burkii]